MIRAIAAGLILEAIAMGVPACNGEAK